MHSVVMPASVLGIATLGLFTCGAGAVGFLAQYVVKGWVCSHLSQIEAETQEILGENHSLWQ